MRLTPLNAAHKEAGAAMVDFSGWEMPVYYANIIDEHKNTRGKAGLFDLCHMGRVKITGPERKKFSEYICTNRITDMVNGQARYSLLCNEKGTIIDDVIVYVQPDYDLIVINAGNRDKDLAHFHATAKQFKVTIDDWSDRWCMIAIQGPESEKIAQPLTTVKLHELKYYYCAPGKLMDLDCLIARTGYTGEDGFEFYFDSAKSIPTWMYLLEAGRLRGLTPVGLGARDTLRLEAGMPLYGHEITDQTNPLEAGLKFAVKLDKENFLGKAALVKVNAAPLPRKLVGIRCEGKRVPRQDYALMHGTQQVGEICSGSYAPTVDGNIGSAYVRSDLAVEGTGLEMDLRGKRVPVQVVSKVFYKRGK